ncbi:MAG TPA: hypothetical protein VF486_21050 [Actinomycetes bacterium]
MTTTREGVAAPAEAPATPGGRPPGDGAEAPRPARQPAASLEPAISGLPQLLRMVGVVAAPTTLLTSLLFYFGCRTPTGSSTTSA